ncbi:hypothetical protein MTO96_042857 [Rhipicephalus appendiculatus]
MLDVADINLRHQDAKRFIRTLIHSGSITHLMVGSTAFTYGRGPDATGWGLADYLLKHDTSLRKVTLKATLAPTKQLLHTINSVLAKMRTLLDFSADFSLHTEWW